MTDRLTIALAQMNQRVGDLQGNAEAMRVLDGVREQTMYWKIQGRACRGTPDLRSDAVLDQRRSIHHQDDAGLVARVDGSLGLHKGEGCSGGVFGPMRRDEQDPCHFSRPFGRRRGAA